MTAHTKEVIANWLIVGGGLVIYYNIYNIITRRK